MITEISKILSNIANPIYLLALVPIICLILYFKNKKSHAILFLITTTLTAVIIKILKDLIAAPRPPAMLILETGYSFPSGHTTFAVVFFGLLTYILTKTRLQKIIFGVLATLLVIVIGLSRLQLQVHFPLDIIGSLIIGGIILRTSILIHKKIHKK